jgi:hypothetical protein
MERFKRFLICPLLAVMVMLSGCLYDSEKLAAKNRADLEERKAIVTDHMETCLNEKYAEVLGKDVSDKLFKVYDLSKGQNQAWFNRGEYPAKATCRLDEYDGEFRVEIYMESNIKSFGTFKDSFYGILYGDEVKEELEELLLEYPVTDIDIYYLPNEKIVTEEAELRENLYVFGKCSFSTPEELDTICELVDKLNERGYYHRIAISDETRSRARSSNNSTSEEIREFFERD